MPLFLALTLAADTTLPYGAEPALPTLPVLRSAAVSRESHTNCPSVDSSLRPALDAALLNQPSYIEELDAGTHYLNQRITNLWVRVFDPSIKIQTEALVGKMPSLTCMLGSSAITNDSATVAIGEIKGSLQDLLLLQKFLTEAEAGPLKCAAIGPFHNIPVSIKRPGPFRLLTLEVLAEKILERLPHR
jgi:hypothetical protein